MRDISKKKKKKRKLETEEHKEKEEVKQGEIGSERIEMKDRTRNNGIKVGKHREWKKKLGS